MTGAPELPVGTVTVLMSDVQASTAAWDRDPKAMASALARHDGIFREAVRAAEGVMVESGREGDSLLCVFTTAADAVRGALEVQHAMSRESWPVGAEISVRIALHTGEPELRDGHYHGPVVYRAARLMATAHGGQVVLSSPTRDIVVDNLPAGVSLLDLGTHVLKDLSRAERVFQLVDPQLRSEFPPLRGPSQPLTNLPERLTSFWGRAQELSDVRTLLTEYRLVTITGTGGLGKTRLVFEVASAVLDEYPGGVWIAELAPLSDPALVPQVVATSLGLRELAGQSLTETLRAHLAQRRLLLVLDNCEHLLEPCANLAEALLASSANVRILATSQQRLGVAGEVVYRLSPLAASTSASADGLDSDSVRLFADRARLHDPRFTLSPGTARTIAQICQRLDGIPLAIELAAARVRLMSVDEVLARLDDRFRLLVDSGRASLPRHQTLRATVDWGYELLSETERALFRRLSVFAGGFTFTTAEAVCAANESDQADVMDLVARLVDKSLVVRDDRGAGGTRLRILETLRQYGRERLEAEGEAGLYSHRHADYFLALAEAARRDQLGPRDATWLERLEAEHDNLRFALETALMEPGETALSLATALLWFWDVRGYLSEGYESLGRALAVVRAPTAARAAAADAAGWLAQRLGDFATARRHFEEGAAIAREVGEPLIRARAMRNLALIQVFSGEVSDALRLVRESLDVAEELKDDASIAGSLLVMALAAYFAGEHEAARAHAERSVDLHRKLGDEKVVAFLLACLARLAVDNGEPAAAASYLAESLEIYREKGDRVDIAFVLETWASFCASVSQPERALRLAGAAAALRESVAALPVPVWRAMLDMALEGARQTLGPAVSEAAFAAGGRMSVAEAIDYASGAPPSST
jgi:predicted ATPase/class 3 adenylate cyclase